MARRYEFYVRVAALTREILFLPRELKIHIFELTCNVLYFINILMMAFLMIFRRFPTTFRTFSKIFQNCSKSQANVREHFSSISEDSRRRRPEDVSMIHQRI